jgi:hypothetical protein
LRGRGRLGAAAWARLAGGAGRSGAASGRRCTFSSGTTFAPVPFVSVSSTQTFAITTVNYRKRLAALSVLPRAAAKDAARPWRKNYGRRHGN